MKAIIHYDGDYRDELVVEADDFEKLKEAALHETDLRGWENNKCWSEVLDE